MHSRFARGLLMVAMALSLAATGTANGVGPSPAGTGQVQMGDRDLTWVLAGVFPLGTLCFVDDDGSATYNPGEPVYATTLACGAAAGVGANDLRLASAAGQAAGTQVRAIQSDFGDPATAFPGGSAVAFYDADGDGVYSLGDPVYVDIGAVAGAVLGTVTVGDLRITPWGTLAAASVVASGNSDLNNALTAGGLGLAAWDPFDADGDGAWTSGDVLYIDADGSGSVTVIDVRLGAIAGKPYGSQVQAGDIDLVYVLAGPLPFAALCFVDDDGSGTYNPGEAVYATTLPCGAAAGVAGNDLRLTSAAMLAAGSQVRATHSDFSDPTTAFPGGSVVAFYDADGDGIFGTGDPVYLDIAAVAGAALGTVTVGDLRLTFGSLGAAPVVASGNSDLNNALTAAPAFAIGLWDSFDADGDGLWTAGDVAFLDADGTGTVTVPDVRLGAIAGKPFGSQVGIGDADLTYVLAGPFPFAAVCFVDDDGSTTYNPGETAYATTLACGAAAGVAGSDLRLTQGGGQPANTQVRATHDDFGDPTTAFPGGSAVAFYDADGDGVYSLGDPVYLDLGAVAGAALGTVTVGDVRLTKFGSSPPATVVTAGNHDLNNGLVAPAAMAIGGWDSFDADGDGLWTVGDVAYIDADASASVTVIDVRLLGASILTEDFLPPPPPPPDGNVTELRLQVEQLLQQNAALDEQVNRTLRQRDALGSEVGALSQRLSDQGQDLSTLSADLGKLRADNQDLTERLAERGGPAPPPTVPGFEALAALAALGVAGLLLWRKR